MNNASISGSNGDDTATIVIGGLIVGLASISVALRFYTRIFTKAGLEWDDWLILTALVLALLTAVLLVWGKSHLLDFHKKSLSLKDTANLCLKNIGITVDPNSGWVADNTDPNYHYTSKDVFYLKLAFTTSILYFTIAGSTKLSILLMYNRLFSVNPIFHRQLITASIVVLGFWIGCTIATLTNCVPLKWSWLNGLSDPRYCFNYNIFWMAAGVSEVLIDILILTLPIRVILTLHLSMGRKAAIACLFLLGGL